MITKKRKIFIVTVASIVLALGCIGSIGLAETQSEQWTQWLNKWEFKGLTLRLSTHAGPTSKAYMTLLPEFEKATGAKVIIIEEPWVDLLAKHMVEFSAHTGTFDILTWPYIWAGYYVEGGMVENLNASREFFNDPDLADSTYDMGDFAPATLEVYGRYRVGKWTQTDALWAVPFKFDIYLAIYRKDLFKEAGIIDKKGEAKPPATYEELIQNAKILHQKFPDIIPVVLPLAVDDPICSTWTPLLHSYGGTWFDENQYPVFHKQPGVKAVKIFVELLPYMPSDAAGIDFDKAITPLEQGLAAYGENWNAFLPTLLDPSASKVVDKIGFALTPAGPAGRTQGLGGWVAGISTDSRHKKAGFVLLQYLTGKQKAVEFALAGGSTPRFSVAKNPRVVEKYPFYPLLMEALEDVAPRGYDRSWTEVQRIIGTALSEVLLGADAEIKLAEAAKEVYKAVVRVGYHPEKTGPFPEIPKK